MVDEATAVEIVEDTFNRLRANILSIIESANLPPRQEKAMRVCIKNRTYQDQAILEELVDILDNDEQTFRYTKKYLERA